MNILLTGGLGFIGSHTACALIEAGHQVAIIDDLSNSTVDVLSRIEQLTSERPAFFQGDIRDRKFMEFVFQQGTFDGVIHFAGKKSVRESIDNPLLYHSVNVDGTISVLEHVVAHSVGKFIFSSSATVYGSAPSPYSEPSETGRGLASPYATSKFLAEKVIYDAATGSPQSFTCLRYFNPVGAHPSGLLGETPSGTPNNLMPFITQTAAGIREQLSIFGNDYPTPDGTALRDYIHVLDLAEAHVRALLLTHQGYDAINVGNGQPISVQEMVDGFEKANNLKLNYTYAPRRDGDLAAYHADISYMLERFNGWRPHRSIEDMCRDAWRFEQARTTQHPSLD